MAAPYERKAILEEQGYRVNAYPNMKECLDAVDRGEADFTYDDMYLVSYYLAASNYKNVKTADAHVPGDADLLRPAAAHRPQPAERVQQGDPGRLVARDGVHGLCAFVPRKDHNPGRPRGRAPRTVRPCHEHTVRAGGRWPRAVRLHACAGGQARLAHPAVQFRSVPQARREVAWTFAALGAQPARHRHRRLQEGERPLWPLRGGLRPEGRGECLEGGFQRRRLRRPPGRRRVPGVLVGGRRRGRQALGEAAGRRDPRHRRARRPERRRHREHRHSARAARRILRRPVPPRRRRPLRSQAQGQAPGGRRQGRPAPSGGAALPAGGKPRAEGRGRDHAMPHAASSEATRHGTLRPTTTTEAEGPAGT